MYHEDVSDYCLSKPGAVEELPFGPDTLVFKVLGKIFALTGLDGPDCRVNLKCDPDRAIQLRAEFPDAVLPGYHMNKVHWNTVICDQGLSRQMICQLIDHSYDLVVASLPAKRRAELHDIC